MRFHHSRVSNRSLLLRMLLVASVLVLTGCETTRARVEIIDACRISPTFCAEDGSGSDVPDFEGGSARILEDQKTGSVSLAISIRGSVQGAEHRLYFCPDDLKEPGGFPGCQEIASLRTGADGNGDLVMEICDESTPRTFEIVALNVGDFQTILANCPSAAAGRCDPDLIDWECPR